MKNLLFYDYKHVFYKTDIKNQRTCANANGTVYIITVSEEENSLEILKIDEENKTVELKNASSIVSELVFLQFEQKLFLALHDEILLISLDLEEIDRITLPEKLLAAKWNSTQDMLCIYHSNGKVACYAINFAIMELVSIDEGDIDDKPQDSVYVGWGSSKTQFQGLKKKKDIVEEKFEYKCEELKAKIDWRGNSEMFVINYFKNGERRINVYDKTCELLYSTVNKELGGFLQFVAFRPTGNKIACVTSKTGRDQSITFIEKNCELINKYLLDEGVTVKEIKWSPCGEYLAVHQEFCNRNFIDLYINTHAIWAVKQRLPIDSSNRLIDFNYVQMLPNMLGIELFLQNGSYQYSFVKKILKSSISEIICSINGRDLNLWFYKEAIAPPDHIEAHYTVTESDVINSVVFHDKLNRVALIQADGNVSIYDYTKLHEWEHIGKFKLSDGLKIAISHYRFYFVGDDFVSISIQPEMDLKTIHNFEVMKSDCDKNIISVQFINSSNEYNFISSKVQRMPLIEILTCEIGDSIYNFFLTAIGGLFINNIEITGEFTSIYLHDNFLLATTKKLNETQYGDSLICLDLKNINKAISEKNILKHGYIRTVEQGAIISHSITDSPMIIIYLPRGNYECIELRNISLIKLRDNLNASEYKKAYNLIKFQSMGINLLIDVNPDGFLNNLKELYNQLSDSNVFIKLMSELKDSSTLSSEDLKIIQPKNLKNKRKEISSALKTFFKRFNNTHENLPVLAMIELFSVSKGFNIQAALEIIASVCLGEYKKYEKQVLTCLALINPYVAYQEIYKVALQLNDLELAGMAANKSNLDPKIYANFIIKLKNSDELTRRYLISKMNHDVKYEALYMLERYRQKQINSVELIDYVIESKSSEKIYKNIDCTDEIFTEIARIYSDELFSKQNAKEAGLVLIKAKLYREAFMILNRSLHWREAIAAIYKIEFDLRPECFEQLADTLKSSGKLTEASDVYIHHCKDFKSGLKCLLEAKNYSQAYHMALFTNEADFVETFLLPHMLQYLNELNPKISENASNFVKMYNRLLQVRKNKIDNYDAHGPIENDLYTDADSIMTKTTTTKKSSSSRASSRSLKKEQRKFQNTREGSKYEDIALIRELYNIVNATFDLCVNVKEAVDLLNLFYNSKQDVHVVISLRKLDDLQQFMIAVANQIWLTEAQIAEKETEGVYDNIIHLEGKYRAKPENMKRCLILPF